MLCTKILILARDGKSCQVCIWIFSRDINIYINSERSIEITWETSFKLEAVTLFL